ncbi:hypothetical protein EDD18DRAFT_1119679 [Armillaria luteobubalina]|uniref:Uncharacterized protein n=1 Tax=Armillaria luteobubalina TaxID=153913 RepID=A0AA39NSR1_9AGAR|nr:hypothetical protein EDD18DRAFT_1119679 [Armillaria luteobubalina]
MAANFVRIAFEDDAWASEYELDQEYILQLPVAAEVVHYFLQFPPRDEPTHVRGSNFPRNPALSMILNAFVAGLGCNVLDSETSQRSIDYLFEPGNLLTVSAVLLTRKARSALRRLALLRRDDPVWPGCLTQLGTQLGTLPVPFEVQFFSRSGLHAISEFRAFVEGGCVGPYGLRSRYGKFTDNTTRSR